jgi:hypothetical protein
MLLRKLASISERLASMFLSTAPDESSLSPPKENVRRGSWLEYDMEGLEEEENPTVEGIEKSKEFVEVQKEAFIDSFPILNTPTVLPPIKPKTAPSPPPGYIFSDPPAYIDLDNFTPTNLNDPAPAQAAECHTNRGVAAITAEQGSVYDNLNSSNPNWLPGLPRPAPGVFVEPPRNRSRVARLRYLSQLNRFCIIKIKLNIYISTLLIFSYNS